MKRKTIISVCSIVFIFVLFVIVSPKAEAASKSGLHQQCRSNISENKKERHGQSQKKEVQNTPTWNCPNQCNGSNCSNQDCPYYSASTNNANNWNHPNQCKGSDCLNQDCPYYGSTNSGHNNNHQKHQNNGNNHRNKNHRQR